MNVKQKDVIRAYKSILTIYDRVIDGYISLPLFRLKKALDAQYQFQQEQERKLAERYASGINKDRTMRFKDDDAKQEFFSCRFRIRHFICTVEYGTRPACRPAAGTGQVVVPAKINPFYTFEYSPNSVTRDLGRIVL